MAQLRYAAKFDPFLSLDCAPMPSTLAQSKERIKLCHLATLAPLAEGGRRDKGSFLTSFGILVAEGQSAATAQRKNCSFCEGG